jgi:hypothetical protein
MATSAVQESVFLKQKYFVNLTFVGFVAKKFDALMHPN